MADDDPKYTRRPFPANSLAEAATISEATQDNTTGRAMNRVLVANAIQRKPASSDFKTLLSSSLKYGLTTGTEKSEPIALTELAQSLTRPRNDSERAATLKKAALEPELLQRIYEHYNNGKLPQGAFFLNVLERDFKVPRDRCDECATIILENGRFAGLLRELQGSIYVILSAQGDSQSASPAYESASGEHGEAASVEEPSSIPQSTNGKLAPPVPEPPAEKFVFIA